jgi:superfamily II DNA or RNA helicase
MFGAIARRVVEEIGGRVLILAHRGELLTQASNTLAAIGLESSIEKADQHARACFWEEPRCVIASVQTMQRKRLLSWPSRHFKLVIVDEAHHVLAESYRKIIDHLAPDWHLGVTATADRLDGSNLGRAYRSVAHEYSLRDAIREGFLAKLRIVRCETSVDLANIKTTGGDLNQGDLEDAIRPHIEELANAIRQEVGDRRTIVFTPDVGSAQAMASALNSLGLRAESISGDSPDRDQIIDGFRKGRFRILVNCALLTEGFDAPFVSAIVLARPTKSRALFAQMAGRGTRLSPGKKECLLIDFAWMTGKHKLITPVDLFDDGGTDPGVKASAKKSLDDGETDDLMEAIERAEETKRERERLRVLARHRPAVYRRISYNPFEAMTEVLGVPVKPESDAALKSRPTDKQLATLAKFGVTNADAMSKRRASMMLDVLIGRAKAGLATMKQVGWATSLGLDPEVARSMTMKEMGAWLDENSKRRA